MTAEKENLLSERANDKQKLQDMAGKTEFLTSNLNEATEERDDALVEIKRLGQEMETVRIENDELQKSKDTKIADLEGQIERLRSETGQISESNTLLESHLGNAKETICSLTNQVSSLQNALKNQAEISDAERKSLESRVKEATAESEKLCTEKEASERLVVKLTSQLKDIDEKLQTQLAQNEERSAEIVEMTVRIESFVMEQNELKQSIERLQAENDKSSKANDALSLEKQALCEKLSELEDQNLSSKAEIETYKASVASLEQASQELRAKLETTETERSQLDESYRVSLLETSTRIEKLESDLSKAKNDLKIAQSDKEELLSKLEEQRNTFDNLETSHNELKLLFASLQAEKTERDEEFQVMSERLHAVNDEKDVVIAEKNSLEAVLTSYQQNVAEMEGLLEAAEGQISRLQKEKDASLAASSQSLQKIQKFATDMKLEKDRVAELEKMKTVLENLCEERQTTINAINAASEGLQGTVDMLMTERDSLKASVDNLEAKLSMSKTEALEKDAIAEELKTANITMTVQLQALSDDVEVRNKEIETLTASHLQATLETKELASRCDVLQEKVNRVSSENNDLCEKLSMAQEELEKNKNEMELMANDLSGSKELASQYDVLQEKVNGLSSENNHLCETLSLVQQQLEKNKNDMESMANELSGLRIDNSEAKEIICLLRRENEAATEEIIALQDQADAVWREAQSLEDRNAELERLHTTAQDDLNRARSKLEEICKELDAAFSSRETLAQSLRDCEAQRDEATLEVQDLFEKNRQLKEALTSSFPREKEQEFLTEIALLKTEIDELKDSLAYISDSESSLRCKIPQLEDELAVRAHDLKEARLRMSQLEEELTLEKQAKPNPEEAQPGLLQRLEELVNEKKELEHQLLEEEDRWKAREAETQKQMGEEQRALIQEGERLMADLRSKLQVCEEQRSQAESEAYTARQQVDEISDERKNLEERYLEVSEQVSSLDKVNSSLKFQITKLTSELGAAKSECYKLKESAIEMKDKMRKVTRESEKAIRDSEISSKEMVSLRKKVSNLERQIESEQVENAGLQKRCQDLEKQSRQMDSLKDDLKSNEILIGSLKKELSNLKLENDSLLEEMRKLKEAKKTPVRAKGGGKENNEHLLIQLQEQIEQQAEEMKQKDARIKKLQVAKMTKEQMQKVKDIMVCCFINHVRCPIKHQILPYYHSLILCFLCRRKMLN
jgi:chromosome segregation ATPase